MEPVAQCIFSIFTLQLENKFQISRPCNLKNAFLPKLSRNFWKPLKWNQIELFQIIEENIPELEAIDLSDNRLTTLDQLADFFAKAKNLKVLYLANNKVSCIGSGGGWSG